MHLIYAVLSILLLGVFSMNMHRNVHHVQNKMILNEIVTELTGAGYDVLEHIGTQAFDENTDESKISPLTYPVIKGANHLTLTGKFGGCTSLAITPTACDDIDDFHGVTTTVDVQGLEYTVRVAVAYVDPANPAVIPGGRTFAKQVALTVSNPYLLLGGDPLEVELKRVYTYNRHINTP